MTTAPIAPALVSGRKILVTGETKTPRAIAAALRNAGAQVADQVIDFSLEAAAQAAVEAAETELGGLDQVVHGWYPASALVEADFAMLDETTWQQGCEAGLDAAWWLARHAIPALARTQGSLVFLIPTLGMSGGAGFTMLASIAEGIRVLAKGCGRQLGVEGVTVNAIATASHLWLAEADAKVLTVATTLSTPAFGRSGDPGADIAPLVALLAQPEAHFVTAGTMVADGGIWMGL